MLPLESYQRYGRQLILDGIGLPGQLKLQSASVAVVGAGGLGCPALQYLAASGIGRIGIIDHDHVDRSNLQRQILHDETTIGMAKADSAARALKRLNGNITIDAITTAVTSLNVIELLTPYDFVLDCTDNAATRYLLSDAAVALRKPLVSGAAQKYEGQLAVYNRQPQGPCYRCVFPKPPPPETVGSCAELGVLGAVTGVIGNMQALETIKLVTGLDDQTPTMLLFSALGVTPFRTVKLRPRRAACPCNDPDAILQSIDQMDYVQFCGGPLIDWESAGRAGSSTRINALALRELLKSPSPPRIIDVRPHVEYGICSLPGSENIVLGDILKNPEKYAEGAQGQPVCVVCRLGNDSQIAAKALRDVSPGLVQDLIGGLKAWSLEVDLAFPQY